MLQFLVCKLVIAQTTESNIINAKNIVGTWHLNAVVSPIDAKTFKIGRFDQPMVGLNVTGEFPSQTKPRIFSTEIRESTGGLTSEKNHSLNNEFNELEENSLPLDPRKVGELTQRFDKKSNLTSYQKIVTGRVLVGYTTIYNQSGGFSEIGVYEIRWRYEREHEWRDFKELDEILNRFPESDSIYKSKERYNVKIKRNSWLLVYGLGIGLASIPLFALNVDVVPVYMLGAGAGTIIFGLIRLHSLPRKKRKCTLKAIDSYNRNLETAENKSKCHLEFGIAANNLGIGVRLNF